MPSMEEVIWDCTYKPGWSFDYEPGEFPMLLIHARVENSRAPGHIEFTVKRLVPDTLRGGSASAIANWVKLMVTEAEVHEVREFFKYKGVVVDDPHKLKIIPPEVESKASLRSSGEWPR
jgi:hypothetical protein